MTFTYISSFPPFPLHLSGLPTAISLPWKPKVPEELPPEEEPGWRRFLPFSSSSKAPSLPDFELEPEQSEWLNDMIPKGDLIIMAPCLLAPPQHSPPIASPAPLTDSVCCMSYIHDVSTGIFAAVVRALTLAAVVLAIAWAPTPFIKKHKG